MSVEHPGTILSRQYLEPLGITRNALALAIGVTPGRIAEIVRGKRDITPSTALMLARFFGNHPEYWTGLQAAYDISLAEKALEYELSKVQDISHVVKKAGKATFASFLFFSFTGMELAAGEREKMDLHIEGNASGLVDRGLFPKLLASLPDADPVSPEVLPYACDVVWDEGLHTTFWLAVGTQDKAVCDYRPDGDASVADPRQWLKVMEWTRKL